jgi:hypothetical protein
MTNFKKGQIVNLVKDWDGKGTVYIAPAIVHSCGKKQMVLTHAVTGVELGRHFRPQREGWGNAELVLTADEDANVIALEMAKTIRAEFIAKETQTIATATGSKEYWDKRRAVLTEVLNGEASVITR